MLLHSPDHLDHTVYHQELNLMDLLPLEQLVSPVNHLWLRTGPWQMETTNFMALCHLLIVFQLNTLSTQKEQV